MSSRDLMQSIRASVASIGQQVIGTYGELTTYDATRHVGKFKIPDHLDSNGNPLETPFIQIATVYTGPGFGVHFPLPLGTQALLLFVDPQMLHLVAICLFYNDVERPPFTDGKSHGWTDSKGSAIKTTDDGASPGDGAGGCRLVGAAYASVVSPKIELAAEGLGSDDKLIRVGDIKTMLGNLQTIINNWAIANLQPGSGAAGPTGFVSGATPPGSSKVSAHA